MKRRNLLIITILIMCIGFAAISTTLVINGNTKIEENKDDFSVIFTSAILDNKNVYASVIDDTKKIINFSTSDLKSINDTSVLAYEITNNSSNYDAEVQVNCKVKDNGLAKYTSIKNELEGNTTVVKSKETLNGTLTVTLNKTATEEVKEEYVCELTFNAVERDTLAVKQNKLYDFIKNNADTTTIIDYSIRSGSSEKKTNGIYTIIENNIPIYYYRGNVNNNLIYNNMCWKIIRTTETGGIKLIYNGKASNNSCNNTGENTQIGTSAWNTTFDDAAYMGYMFGINNTGNSTSKEEAQTNTYESTIKKYIDTWFSTNFDENSISMLEDTIYCNDRSTTTGTNNNIVGDVYGELGYGKNATAYGSLARSSYYTKIPKPTLKCSSENDKFTVSTANGNGKLTYPVGLITSDEAILAGFNTYTSNTDNVDSNYLFTGNFYWTMTPVYMYPDSYAATADVGNEGYIRSDRVDFVFGVRPVISLKNEIIMDDNGTGSLDNPFMVKGEQ